MAGENTTISIDWDGLRDEAIAIDQLVDVLKQNKEAIDADASTLDSYSSEFVGQLSVSLRNAAQIDITNLMTELQQYSSGLNATADTHQENETSATQTLSNQTITAKADY